MRASRIIATLGIAILVAPLWMIGSWYVRKRGYERNYATVVEGQSEQNVVTTMGQPDERELCQGPVYSNGKMTGQCSERLVYYSFMERWGVVLDKNGTVVAKYYNVSY